MNALIKVSSRSTIAVILFPAFRSALIYIRLCMKPRSCSQLTAIVHHEACLTVPEIPNTVKQATLESKKKTHWTFKCPTLSLFNFPA